MGSRREMGNGMVIRAAPGRHAGNIGAHTLALGAPTGFVAVYTPTKGKVNIMPLIRTKAVRNVLVGFSGWSRSGFPVSRP